MKTSLPIPVESPELAIVFPRAGVMGGVERVALDLVRYESSRRRTCFVGAALDDLALPHRIVRPRRVPRSLRPLEFRRAAGRVVRALDAGTSISFGVNCPPGDVYWVHSVHAAWLEDGGDIVYRGVRIPPGVRKLLLRHRVLLRLEHDYFVNHHPRAILCTSTREANDLNRLYGVARDVMHVVPNGFDGHLFSVGRRATLRREMRHAIGARPDEIVVLMVANEWHRKGLGTLLEAVSRLGDNRIRIDLVGAHAPEDYGRMAVRLGISDRLHWHGPSADVARFQAAADLFVLPTTYEPFGLVIIEAMASGLPVVASRLAGASAAIDDGVNGLLLDDPRDVDELVVALKRLLEPDERDRLGSTAGAAVASYEWDQILSRVDGIIFPE